MEISSKKLLFPSPSVESHQERECTVEDFESISNRAIGEGAFGQVFKVRHIQTGNLYAIKMISKSKILEKNMLTHLKREIRIMYSLNHPYIIKLHNHFEDHRNFYLILQLAEGGSLFNKLSRVRSFDEKTAAQYIKEVALAVQYLHTREPPIIHRDIKPENIFLDKDGVAKLGDFGWSCCSEEVRSTYCGTLEYLAPEMIDRSGHDTRLDLWNLGVLLFELLVGRAPFQSANQEELFYKIKSLKVGFPKGFSESAKDLVRGLLKSSPQERISIKALLEHPWITQHPPLRRTCELQTKTEKLPEDYSIPENQYKVISQAERSQELLLQEKVVNSQMRTKLKNCEKEISQLDIYLKRLQEKQVKLESGSLHLQGVISQLNFKLLRDTFIDEDPMISEMQEDLDNKIVKIQVKLRKLDFELKMKNKEAANMRSIAVGKEIKLAVAENTLLGLRSYSKEFRWLVNINKSLFFTQEFNKILMLIEENRPDDLVRSCLEDISVHFDTKPEIQENLEDLQDLVTQKKFSLGEVEEKIKELEKVSKMQQEAFQVLFPNKYRKA